MDIIDILIARSMSFSAETSKLVQQAEAAMAKANEVAAIIADAQNALEAAAEAQEAAEAANTRSTEVAAQFEEISNDLDEAVQEAASAVLDDKIAAATSEISSSAAAAQEAATEAQAAAADAVTDVEVINDDTAAAKVKKTRVRKRGIQQAYDTMKNYTSTGSNEDGSMTQKAITQALQNQRTEIETRINNIIITGGGSGNVSGNISAEDEGSIVAVDSNGNITSSSITETDVVITQIVAGTYQNENILGLEIDYANRTFTRLQGAKQKTAGTDFNQYSILGGRKRCIVNADGSIERFLTANDTLASINNKRIMVYQPAVYYLRVPLSTTTTTNGTKVNKEHIYISNKKYAGFELHPLFKDANGNPVKYVLLPAFESGTLRSNGTVEKQDSQDINFAADKLISVAEAKPISGETQDFTYSAAVQMARNNGTGWDITDLRFESLNQMLMMIEYGTMNLQNGFNRGISSLTSGGTINTAAYTGSTFDLFNTSRQAAATLGYDGSTYTNEGYCAISYRGIENPYGNIWRFMGNVKVIGQTLYYYDEPINFKLPSASGWIQAIGYDKEHDWVFLPIADEATIGNSSLPVGDYLFIVNNATVKAGICGGLASSQEYAGPFYYSFNIRQDNYHYRSDSARVMFIPTANSAIETSNYNIWTNS